MAKVLTPLSQRMLNNADVTIKFIFKIASIDQSDYLINWSIQYSKEFGSASATFMLNNNDERFTEGGSAKINIGDVVELSEYFEGDSIEWKKFYGLVNQRSIHKTADSRSITLVCLDYISILQFLDIDLEEEGTKVEITNETLTPNYLSSPNENLAHLFDFANTSIADNPRPVIMVRNKNTSVDDPQYDGFEIYYSTGQLRLGYPLNARYNYDVLCTSYYFYTHGVFIEDIIEDILIENDGYGNFLFGESSAQNVIDNHLTETFNNVEGTNTDYLTPNLTPSTITIETTLTSAITAGNTSINVTSTSGFSQSGQATVNGDIFTYTGKTATTLSGIPATGSYALKSHPSGSYVEYENTYAIGRVWYLKYSNLTSTLTTSDFIIPGGTFNYFDARNGRIILTSGISTSAIVKCNTNYSFKTLQSTGVELNKISFRSREMPNRYEAINKLRQYLAPNYIVRTRGDNKIWASYLTQRTIADYTLQLVTGATYLEDEDLYTRVMFWGKNENPTNLMFKDGVDFITTGASYKAIVSNSELTSLREEGNYYVYGSSISGVGKILANTIKPIVYINGVPIDNTSHLIAGQQVITEITTKTETSVSGGGK